MDTVQRAITAGDWKAVVASKPPCGWKYHRHPPARRHEKTGKVQGRFWNVTLTHCETQTRILGNDKRPCVIKAELPKLIFPGNGFVITTQEELNNAVSRLHSLALEVVFGLVLGDWQRLHLAWNLPVNTRSLNRTLRKASHKWFRRLPDRVHAVGDSDTPTYYYPGAGKTGCIYDKGQEQGSGQGFCRPELRLENPFLKARLFAVPDRANFHLHRRGIISATEALQRKNTLNLADCYDLWREFLFGFEGGEKLFAKHLPLTGPPCFHQNPNNSIDGKRATPATAAAEGGTITHTHERQTP